MLIQSMLAFRPSKVDVIFSLKTFAAAMLALYIAIALNLQNPMWAMGTVFIVASPMSGMLASKAVFRLLGTFSGACMSIILLPAIINNALPFTLVIAAWVSICLYISLLDRTPRSYFFMLSGYTLALIGFSAAVDPTNLFNITLSRFEEITLGILSATIISRVVLPLPIGPVLSSRINKWIGDIELNFKKTLNGHVSHADILKETQRFATDVTELHELALHLSYENTTLKNQAKAVQELQHSMILLVPALVALSDRISALQQSVNQPLYQNLFDQIALALEQYFASCRPRTKEDIDFVPPSIMQHFDQLLLAADLNDKIIIMSARESFLFFIRHIQSIRAIWLFIQGGKKPPSFLTESKTGYQNLHIDHGIALRAAASAFLAICIACFLWFMSGWTYGYMVAQLTAVFACILTFLDNPVPALASFIKASIYSSIVVFFYHFAVFPMITNFSQMMIVIFPFFFYFAATLSSPTLRMFSLPMLITTAMSLNIQNINVPNFNAFFDSSLASIIGVIIPSFTIALIRSMSPEHSAQRLLMAQWRDIQKIIEKPVLYPWAYYIRRLLDRIGLMVPRVLRSSAALQEEMVIATIELAGTTNIVRLKRAQANADSETKIQIQQVLDALWIWYEQRIQQQHPSNSHILQMIDDFIYQLLPQENSQLRDQLLVSLMGLRRSLFNDAAPLSVTKEISELSIPALGGTYGWRA